MSDFPEDLFELAYMQGAQDGYADLVELAEPENWNYVNSISSRPNPVLTNYISHTYKRLVEQEKIFVTQNGEKLCFNTGLVTPNQEEIFALFSVNRAQDKQPWFCNGWRKSNHHDLSVFSSLPDLAQYFDDPTALFFDARKELRINVDHIIEENKDRFPERYKSTLSFELRNLLNGALEAVKKRVRRNYKSAIPQYYQGRIQILLPICLSVPNVADLALAVERYHDHYRGSTCLTLDMAYNNARQIAKPDRDWLQP